jgi:hypothetical protein
LDKGLQFVTNGEAVVSILQYTTPELAKGLTLNVNSIQAGTVNNADAMSDAATVAVNYSVGALSTALDFRSNDDRTRGTVTYDFGVAKAAVGFINSYGAVADSQVDMDIAIPMGAVTLAAQYVKRGDDKGYALGASYALSKRTSINLAYANIDSTSAAAVTAATAYVQDTASTAAKAATTGFNYNGGQTRLRLNHTF